MPKISVILPNELDERFSEFCEERGYKKSTLAKRLIKEHLDMQGFGSQKSLQLEDAKSDVGTMKKSSSSDGRR